MGVTTLIERSVDVSPRVIQMDLRNIKEVSEHIEVSWRLRMASTRREREKIKVPKTPLK
jgi:hypothetical protein